MRLSKWFKGVIAILTCLALLVPLMSASSSSWLGSWAKRVKVTIDASKVGGALVNFPVMLHLSASSGVGSANVSDIFSLFGTNREKIAVTTSDGITQCYVEVEKWDPANSEAILWAKVSSISATVNTDLYLYYDNAQPDNVNFVGGITSTPGKAVWDSNFVSVHHLSEQGTGAVGEYKDSTVTGNNGSGGSKSTNPKGAPRLE